MTLVISSEETFFHKATQVIVDGDQVTWMTSASSDPDDTSVDVHLVSTRFAWVIIKAMAEDGVVWYGEVLR